MKSKETGLSKFVPTDAGIQLNTKEKKDEDTKAMAASNPIPQETSFCMQPLMYLSMILIIILLAPNSSLPMEVTTSVGQPTTLFVELPYADDSEIIWKKDGKPVTYPVLPDGSLYIESTKLSDQGGYTVTASSTDNTTSESLQLVVIDPKMPTSEKLLCGYLEHVAVVL